MNKKELVFIFAIFILVFIFIIPVIILAQASTAATPTLSKATGAVEDKSDQTVIGKFLRDTGIYSVWNGTSTFTLDKFYWIIGSKTFGGKSVNILHPFTYITEEGWRYAIFGLLLGFFLSIFMILNRFYDMYREWRYHIILNAYHNLKEDLKKIWKIIAIFIVSYVILMGIPIIKRVLQIVTLDFLGMPMFLRALVIAAIIAFAPLFAEHYNKYRKRTKIYEEEMGKIATEEAAKMLLKK